MNTSGTDTEAQPLQAMRVHRDINYRDEADRIQRYVLVAAAGRFAHAVLIVHGSSCVRSRVSTEVPLAHLVPNAGVAFSAASHLSELLNVQDVAEVLKTEFPQQIDVAYEGVGGELRQAVLDNLSPNGCLLSVGYISEYPHVKSDVDDDGHQSSNGSSTAAQSKSDLPPAHELFWQRQVIKRGNQTLYGDVWSGVSTIPI